MSSLDQKENEKLDLYPYTIEDNNVIQQCNETSMIPNNVASSLRYIQLEIDSLKAFKIKVEKYMASQHMIEYHKKNHSDNTFQDETYQDETDTETFQAEICPNEIFEMQEADSIDAKTQLDRELQSIKTQTAELERKLERISDRSVFRASQKPVSRRTLIRSLTFVSQFLPEVQNTDEEVTRSLPQNSYSFMICSEVRSVPFCIGIVVVLLQVLTTLLLSLNLMDLSKGRQPIRVPPNVDNIVRCTQFIAIIISVLIQDDIRITMKQLLEGYGKKCISQAFNDVNSKKFWVVSSCQFFEAMLVLLASFFLIVNAEDIESVLLNFTAVGFISVLDKVAFQLASAGFFGKVSMANAKLITETTYFCPSATNKQHILQAGLVILYCLMLITWGIIVHTQVSGYYLCKQIHVQFGDDLAVFSGLYDMEKVSSLHGRVEYKERRNKNEMGRGKFAYCKDEHVWTFSYNTTNPCNGEAKSTILDEYDILNTLSIPWNFDGSESAAVNFQLSCFRKRCNGEACACPVGLYGITCDVEEPCPMVSVNGITNFNDWQKNFMILRSNNNGIGTSVQAYHRPIYVGKEFKEGSADIVIYTGRRWALLNTAALPRSNHIFYGLTNASDYADIAEYFYQHDFHAFDLPPGSVTLISEAADVSSIIPLNLKWFYPQYSGLLIPDLKRSGEGNLFCAFCDDESNPCLFEGVCQASDGTCKCKHGTKGTMCEKLPTGNGICNPFFNSHEFHYDGGDCCGATCADKINCGIKNLAEGFGTLFATPADGYPECQDPTMIPITVRIKLTYAYFFGFHLVCGGKTYMRMPEYALFVDSLEGTEVNYIRDGEECELVISAERNFSLIGVNPTYLVEIYYGNGKNILTNSSNETTDSLLARIEGGVVAAGTVAIVPFIVIKSCLFRMIPNAVPEMLHENTPQGQALRWLNSDTSTRSSCSRKSLPIVFQQRYALAVLNFATNNIIRNISSTWLTDINECDWRPGITCVSNDTITGIDLYNSDLSGLLPSEIGLLQSLITLDLGYNRLGGSIPSEVGNLVNLKKLQMFKNYITGTIPKEIGKLLNLEIFHLGINGLNGRIPSQFGGLVNLKHFRVGVNHLTGEIPNEIFHLVNLTYIVLTENSLTGTLPTSIGNFQNLNTLSLVGNSFSGTIPTTLGKLTKLHSISLFRNQFSGSIPSEIGNLTGLVTIELNNNVFFGTIPSELSNLVASRVIVLSNNFLVGTVPTLFGSLVYLKKLNLDFNYLKGKIPSELGGLIKLEDLKLNNNQLSGPVPNMLGNLSNLHTLDLHDNTLNGMIPDKVCGIHELEQLVVDCEEVICPIDCICRGKDSERNSFFSCPSSISYPFECEAGYMHFQVEIVHDRYASETTWDLVVNGKEVLQGNAKRGWACIPKDACGIFTINDEGGNGICCNPAFGYGSYTLFLNGEKIASGGAFTESESVPVGLPSCDL